ncbi:MAG: hypothetical protein L6Q76_37345 [Polyangiaceae bacterium]|nr:hypothetical protein [Polyangiaceae bacterium]
MIDGELSEGGGPEAHPGDEAGAIGTTGAIDAFEAMAGATGLGMGMGEATALGGATGAGGAMGGAIGAMGAGGVIGAAGAAGFGAKGSAVTGDCEGAPDMGGRALML